uniref:Uncharacterized protein n=1 Tax=Oryza sativa subsp. japonica TaxID=39947 RepID=Q67U46_ORYSJ|nr:hypothetical protein [Oryza sativa Japonica Group]
MTAHRAFGPARHGPRRVGPCLGRECGTWAGTARPGASVGPCRPDKPRPRHGRAWAVPCRAAHMANYNRRKSFEETTNIIKATTSIFNSASSSTPPTSPTPVLAKCSWACSNSASAYTTTSASHNIDVPTPTVAMGLQVSLNHGIGTTTVTPTKCLVNCFDNDTGVNHAILEESFASTTAAATMETVVSEDKACSIFINTTDLTKVMHSSTNGAHASHGRKAGFHFLHKIGDAQRVFDEMPQKSCTVVEISRMHELALLVLLTEDPSDDKRDDLLPASKNPFTSYMMAQYFEVIESRLISDISHLDGNNVQDTWDCKGILVILEDGTSKWRMQGIKPSASKNIISAWKNVFIPTIKSVLEGDKQFCIYKPNISTYLLCHVAMPTILGRLKTRGTIVKLVGRKNTERGRTATSLSGLAIGGSGGGLDPG